MVPRQDLECRTGFQHIDNSVLGCAEDLSVSCDEGRDDGSFRTKPLLVDLVAGSRVEAANDAIHIGEIQVVAVRETPEVASTRMGTESTAPGARRWSTRLQLAEGETTSVLSTVRRFRDSLVRPESLLGTPSFCGQRAKGLCQDLGHAHQAGLRSGSVILSSLWDRNEGRRLHRPASGRRDREDPAPLPPWMTISSRYNPFCAQKTKFLSFGVRRRNGPRISCWNQESPR